MRVLFISGTMRGGSGRSQRDLAAALRARGHDVVVLVDDEEGGRLTRWLYGHLSDLSVRVADLPVIGLVERFRDSLGRRTRLRNVEGVPHQVAILPQNALPHLIGEYRPDAVVANSVERWAWRLICRFCEDARLPTVLYVREEDSLAHLDVGDVPTALVANTRSLARALEAQGYDCEYIPSLIDTSVTLTESTRDVVLAINPIRIKGSDLVWEVAERLPHIPFAVQEAWPLDGEDLEEVERRVRSLPNVHFRRLAPPGPDLYRDARVLMAPYRVDSRPRVVLEAHANGIPVLASDLPALVEAVGGGGITLPVDDVAGWVDTIQSLWEDEPRYRALSDGARRNSDRADVSPKVVADAVEGLLLRATAPTVEGRA